MSKNFWQLFLRGAIAAACLVLGVAAQAAVYRSAFDPPFFKGYVDFDVVEPQCTATNGYFTTPPSGCSIFVKLAHVEILDGPDVGDIFDRMSATFLSPIDTPLQIDAFYIAGNLLQGANIGPLIPIGTGGTSTDYYWLEYQFGFPGDIPTQFVNLYKGQCFAYSGDADICVEGSPGVAIPALEVFPFERIPEPATLGLLLSGLGAGWLARRRRK